MKLECKELKTMPPLYATDGKPASEKKIAVKFFNPCGAGTWYGIEYDPESKTFFGYVDLQFKELGYFNLDELKNIKLPFGLGIERDLQWNPNTTLQDVLDGKKR